MNTPPKCRRLDPHQRRKQILEAANALFAERTYDEVSIEDIASSASVTRGLVHHYFGGRKEVYIALLERLGAQREEQLPPPTGRSARARLADTVSRWLDWTEANRTIWLATIARGEDITDPDVRRVVAELVGRAVALLTVHHAGIAGLAAALRARMLDRAKPRRNATLATRRGHPRGDTRVARLDARACPTHIRRPTHTKAAHISLLDEKPTVPGRSAATPPTPDAPSHDRVRLAAQVRGPSKADRAFQAGSTPAFVQSSSRLVARPRA